MQVCLYRKIGLPTITYMALLRGRYGPVVRIYTTRCGDSSSPSLYGDAILVVWSGLDLYPP